MTRFLLAPFICWLSLGTAFTQTPLAERPLQFHDRVPFFEANINGAGPFLILYDSGAGITALDSDAERLIPGLQITGTSRISTSGRDLSGRTATDNRMQIGALVLDSITFELIPLRHLSDYFGLSIHGIIGYDLFSRFVVECEVDEQVLRLYETVPTFAEEAWTKLPTKRMDNRKVVLETDLLMRDGRMVGMPLSLDTAYPDAITLFPGAWETFNLDLRGRKRYATGFSADTTITSNQKRLLRRVSLAGKTWRRVPVVLTTDPVSVEAFGSNQSVGLLGQQLFLQFNSILDYRNDAIYLQARSK